MKSEGKINKAVITLIEKYAVNLADRIMCVSECSYNYFLNIGVDPAKIRIVRNGVDVERFKPNRPAFSQNNVTILYAGRISADKGVYSLIDVFYLLVKNRERSRLLIVGEGPDKVAIEKTVKRLGMERYVMLLPSVERTDMINLYKKSDVVIVPSVVETGTPLTLLEAMACERFVIVNSYGFLPHVVDNTGLVVNFDDPQEAANVISKMLDDKEKATMMTRLARKRIVKNFNWRNCFKEILKTYLETICE